MVGIVNQHTNNQTNKKYLPELTNDRSMVLYENGCVLWVEHYHRIYTGMD